MICAADIRRPCDGGIMVGRNILIIEDDELIADILAEMVEEMGHTVAGIAETEKKAIALAAKTQPDFLICDVTLEEGSGIAAAEAICAARPVPHLFASGDIARVKAARPDAVILEKPFRQGDVAAAIDRALATAD